jgi:hypothetical protein
VIQQQQQQQHLQNVEYISTLNNKHNVGYIITYFKDMSTARSGKSASVLLFPDDHFCFFVMTTTTAMMMERALQTLGQES